MKKQLTALDALKELDKRTQAEVYITGGYVRDLIRRRKNNDLDIVVRNMPLKSVARFLSKYGKVDEVHISNPHDKFALPILVFNVKDDPTEIQITLPRRGKRMSTKNTLRQDSKCRDFTINAMYLPVNTKSSKKIIDYTGGVTSIRRRRIEAIGNASDRLKESPIRIMRAFTLSSRMNYQISAGLLGAIEKNRELITLAPPENIQAELNEILMSKRPSKYLKLMKKIGILSLVMPELYKCSRVTQDRRFHKYDVFTHCVYTCDHAPTDLVLRLAALLHDVGKADTRAEVSSGTNSPPRITFHRHEMVSVNLAREFMSRLRYKKDIVNGVIKLIQFHMYHYTSDMWHCTENECGWTQPVSQMEEEPKWCPRCGAPLVVQAGWTDAAIRRFISRVGINASNIDDLDNHPLFLLRAAERLGNGKKKIAVTAKQIDFQSRIVDVFNSSRGLTINDLDINGNVIMDMFKLKPSQQIGEILKHLLNDVLENPSLNERVELVKLTAEYLCKKNNECWTRKP